VRYGVGAELGGRPTALTASPTTGGGGIQVVRGLVAEFEVEAGGGSRQTVRAPGYVGIKANDAGSDVLGMEQLAAVNAAVSWNPGTGEGSLHVPADDRKDRGEP